MYESMSICPYECFVTASYKKRRQELCSHVQQLLVKICFACVANNWKKNTQIEISPSNSLHKPFVPIVDWPGTEGLHVTQIKQSTPERALFLIREVSVRPRAQGASCWGDKKHARPLCYSLGHSCCTIRGGDSRSWRELFSYLENQISFWHMQFITWRISVDLTLCCWNQFSHRLITCYRLKYIQYWMSLFLSVLFYIKSHCPMTSFFQSFQPHVKLQGWITSLDLPWRCHVCYLLELCKFHPLRRTTDPKHLCSKSSKSK